MSPAAPRRTAGTADGRHPADCAPFYVPELSGHYHTRLDCSAASSVPAAERRVDHLRLAERLPYW